MLSGHEAQLFSTISNNLVLSPQSDQNSKSMQQLLKENKNPKLGNEEEGVISSQKHAIDELQGKNRSQESEIVKLRQVI